MIKGGEAAIDLAIERLPPDLRQRPPSKKKPELIALQVTAKPETEAHLKTLYGYAPVLFVARVRGLSPDAFEEWVPNVNLDDCKVQATKIRAALKAGAPVELDEPEATVEEPWLDIRCGRGRKAIGSYKAKLPEQAYATVAELLSGAEVNGASHTLKLLADALDALIPAAGDLKTHEESQTLQ